MPTKREGTSVRIPQEKYAKLRKVKKRTGLDQNDIIATLIDMADKFDLLRPDWQKRLNAALIAVDREIESAKYSDDPNRCPAMAKGSKKYKCVWGRKEKTPEVRVLEEFYEASKELCSSCKVTLAMREETAGLKNEVLELQNKLRQRADIVYMIPVCEAVGVLNSDGTLFSRCQEYNMRAVNIEKFCKIKNNGEPCDWYKESIVGVAEKIK